MDLRTLARLDAIADAVADGASRAGRGLAAGRRRHGGARPYGAVADDARLRGHLGARPRASSAAALREIAAAGVLGLVHRPAVAAGRARRRRSAACSRRSRPWPRRCCPAVAARAFAPVSVYITTVAGIIVLVPGFTLTVAMTELATRNLVSGTARLAGAAGTFLAIGFGVALGTRVGVALFGAATLRGAPARRCRSGPSGSRSLSRRSRSRCSCARPSATSPGSLVAGVLGVRRRAPRARSCSGPELGTFVGAFVVAGASNAYARALDRPSPSRSCPGCCCSCPAASASRACRRSRPRDGPRRRGRVPHDARRGLAGDGPAVRPAPGRCRGRARGPRARPG